MRVPCGVVVAITPFNFPLLLVLHKLAPALAAGNAVILKPASATPLVALKLTELMLEAGLPPLALQCITGDGSMLGNRLCADPRVRKITFTGSTAVGEQITRVAGIKRLSLELGGNAPVVVLRDGDVEAAAEQTAIGGYVNAGQVCISTQRVIVERQVYGDFLDALAPQRRRDRDGRPARRRDPAVGDDLRARGRSGSELDPGGRRRRRQASSTGGERDGAVHGATVVSDVRAVDADLSRGAVRPRGRGDAG